MTFLRAPLAALVLTGLLSACGGSGGNEPGMPTGFTVEAGDGQAVIRWTDDTSLTYWIFSAQATEITREDYRNFAGARITWPARSPAVIGGLVNGLPYAFLINATSGSSAAGPATPSLTITPRLAGANWKTWPSGTTADLRGLTYNGLNLIATGAGGSIVTSTNGETWTTRSSGVSVALNGVASNNSGTRVVAVGDGGTVITSTDAATWTTVTSGTTTDLAAVGYGNGRYVAVGAGGAMITSTDGTTWSAGTSGVTANLTQAGYSNSTYWATGANGTLLTSADGLTWTARSTGVTAPLRSLTYGNGLWLAVGDNGTLLTSPDLVTWTAQPGLTSEHLYAAVYGSQFVLAGANGVRLYGTTGTSWTAASGTGTVRKMLRTGGAYFGVGDGGLIDVAR